MGFIKDGAASAQGIRRRGAVSTERVARSTNVFLLFTTRGRSVRFRRLLCKFRFFRFPRNIFPRGRRSSPSELRGARVTAFQASYMHDLCPARAATIRRDFGDDIVDIVEAGEHHERSGVSGEEFLVQSFLAHRSP